MSGPFRALMATSAVMVGGVALIGGAGTALASQTRRRRPQGAALSCDRQ